MGPLIAAGLSALAPVVGGLLAGDPEEPSMAQRTTSESTTPTIPDWAMPYVTGDNIRRWPTQQVNPEYLEYMRMINEGQFAGQDRIDSILGMDELTDPSQGAMANLLGIGSQYSQRPPDMFLPEPVREAAPEQQQQQMPMQPQMQWIPGQIEGTESGMDRTPGRWVPTEQAQNQWGQQFDPRRSWGNPAMQPDPRLRQQPFGFGGGR